MEVDDCTTVADAVGFHANDDSVSLMLHASSGSLIRVCRVCFSLESGSSGPSLMTPPVRVSAALL
jgi:hypothetical protein